MGRVEGCTILRDEGEAMHRSKIPEFLVLNNQKEEDGQQHRIISLW